MAGMYRKPLVPMQSGQFLGGGAAATLDILQQVQKAGSAQAFRSTVHVKDEALLMSSAGADEWGDAAGEEEGEDEEESSGIRARVAKVVGVAAQAKWLEQQRQMQAAALSHLELSMPLARRAVYFKQKVEQKRATESDKKEAEEALAAEASDKRPTDFDFTGDGRPFRFACGKASRVLGGREAARALGVQLREGRLELTVDEKSCTVRHGRQDSPFGGLGVSGLLAQAQVRCPFRDFIVEWARDNAIHYQGKPGGWRDGGLRYTSLGSGELLLDLELLERIRGLGVRIGQICLVDKLYKWPMISTMRALQEFTDFQRATALLAREEPAEVLAFGSLEDYREAAKDKTQCCHLLLHCDSYSEGIVDDDECERLAMQVLVHGGLLARLTNMRSGLGFAAAAWALVPGGPDCQGGVDLSALSDPLLAACNDAIASPAVQMRVQVHALAQVQKQAAELPRVEEEEDKPRPKTEAELAALEAAARDADRARGLSEAQVLARSRMRQWDRGHGVAGAAGSKAKPARKTPLQERAEHYGLEVWRVIHKPHVAVRGAPKGTAKIVGQLDYDQEIMVSKERKGHWLRISEGPVLANLPTEAWVLTDASEGLGISMMLEKVE